MSDELRDWRELCLLRELCEQMTDEMRERRERESYELCGLREQFEQMSDELSELIKQHTCQRNFLN